MCSYGPQDSSTHERTIHWMLIITHPLDAHYHLVVDEPQLS
jgi:hypothetical protein